MTASHPGKHLLQRYGSFLFLQALMLLPPNIWGAFNAALGIITKELHPIVFTFVRSFVMAVTLFFAMVIADRKFQENHEKTAYFETSPKAIKFFWSRIPNTRNMILCFCAGLLIAVNITVNFYGVWFTSSITLSIVSPFSAVVTTIIAIIIRIEKSTIVKWIGIGCAVVGAVAMVIIRSLTSSGTSPSSSGPTASFTASGLLGLGLLLFGVLCYSTQLHVTRTVLVRGIPTLTASFWIQVYTSLVMGIASIFVYKEFAGLLRLSLAGWIALAFTCTISGGVVLAVQSYLTKAASPSMVGLYATLIPVTGTVYTFLITGSLQDFSWYSLIGAALIVIGVVIVTAAKFKESSPPKTTTTKEEEMTESQSEDLVSPATDEMLSPLGDDVSITVQNQEQTLELLGADRSPSDDYPVSPIASPDEEEKATELTP